MTEPPPKESDAAEVLERISTPRGEFVLRRVGAALEVISNGMFLMDTRGGTSERRLVSEALRLHAAPRRLLIGGLGVGFSLLEAVRHAGLESIVVVEIERVLLDWHRSHLQDRTAGALADPRVAVVIDDVREHLEEHPADYDVVCLDVDNGPDWTVTDSNDALYGASGLMACVDALDAGGVLAVWSASRSPSYEDLLGAHLDDVTAVEVAAQTARGGPDVIYLGRRRADR